jgi:hypothetical protein
VLARHAFGQGRSIAVAIPRRRYDSVQTSTR